MPVDFWFWCFVALLGISLLRMLSKPRRIYEYPYFMAATFAIFILPQAISLKRFPGAAPEQAAQNVIFVTCLCLAGCFLEYRVWNRSRALRAVSRSIDEMRLFHAGIVFVCCGIGFTWLLSRTEIQTSEFGGWTGPATIYGFFQQLCYPGFAICLMTALRRPNLLSVGSSLLAAAVPLQSIVFGRREPAAMFVLTIGLTFYFSRKLAPSRWLVVLTILVAMVAIPATATYRRFQLQNDWESVRQIDFVGNFQEFLNQESVLELRNAAMLIEATRRSGEYEYGAGYWNHLVFRYVPAQILGPSFKESLMIRHATDALERELAGMDYVNPAGSTVTAMGDSFQQFGYWGCLFFVVLGLFFRTVWRAAAQPNGLFAQLLYMQCCTSAMRAVTHWTLDFLPGLCYNAIFLGAALMYASRCGCLDSGDIRMQRVPRPRVGNLFPQGFGNDENQYRPAQPASEKQVK
jgi:hypothetical protein